MDTSVWNSGVFGAMICPLRLAVIGHAARMVARLVPSSVLVPATRPVPTVVMMPMSKALTSEDAMSVRFFISAAIVGRVPPEPAPVQPVAFTMSICIGTPAAKKVVVTDAEMRTSLMTHRRVASFHRNWNSSALADAPAGMTPERPP